MDHAIGDPGGNSKVDWREWGPASFEAASEDHRPVLLSLSAPWCSACHEMDAETYGEPRIAAHVGDSFVPVRVNVDRRPRVRDRYAMGGFPTTTFLTPDGRVLATAGYLDEDSMRETLGNVRDLWEEEGASAGTLPPALRDAEPPSGAVSDEIERYLAGRLNESEDSTHGGWGGDPKLPMPRTIEFALKRDREAALRALDAIESNLEDEAGGFFRYAEGADWSEPSREKLLEVNAGLARAFANAYLYTGEDAYRETADRTVEYLTTTLWTGEGFAGSEIGGASEAVDGSESAGEDGGFAGRAIDETVFANRNAMAVDALLTYHAYTDDERARDYAERALCTLRTDLLEDGTPVHYHDGEQAGPRGLLGDAAHLLAALTSAREVLGADTLEEARRLADATIESLFDDHGFRDGPLDGPALLDRPLWPIDDNYELAGALLDLHALTGVDRYREVARDAIGAFAGAPDRLGVRVAGYGTVAARIVGPAMRIDVGTPAGSDLHRAALRVADHEKVVVPDVDDLDGTARVVIGDSVSEPAETPGTLMKLVAAHV